MPRPRFSSQSISPKTKVLFDASADSQPIHESNHRYNAQDAEQAQPQNAPDEDFVPSSGAMLNRYYKDAVNLRRPSSISASTSATRGALSGYNRFVTPRVNEAGAVDAEIWGGQQAGKLKRELSRYGMNPNSGRFADTFNDIQYDVALLKNKAMNDARRYADQRALSALNAKAGLANSMEGRIDNMGRFNVNAGQNFERFKANVNLAVGDKYAREDEAQGYIDTITGKDSQAPQSNMGLYGNRNSKLESSPSSSSWLDRQRKTFRSQWNAKKKDNPRTPKRTDF